MKNNKPFAILTMIGTIPILLSSMALACVGFIHLMSPDGTTAMLIKKMLDGTGNVTFIAIFFTLSFLSAAFTMSTLAYITRNYKKFDRLEEKEQELTDAIKKYNVAANKLTKKLTEI